MYAPKQKQAFARKLKKHQTRTEKRMRGLWLLGFNSQTITPCGYIADWYWPAGHIIVEVDGGVHKATRKADRRRDSHHRERGIYTVRLKGAVVERYLWWCYLKVLVFTAGWTLVRWLWL